MEIQDEYPFPSAREAVAALANKNFRAAAVWNGQHLLNVDKHDTDQYIETYHRYCESTTTQLEALALTNSQAAEFIISGYSTSLVTSGQQSAPSPNLS
tara:strand:+ start:229 stop:522 length:294 start_codon:yes stop_codon:yes gene_type:complete